jgi:hypothetical protein
MVGEEVVEAEADEDDEATQGSPFQCPSTYRCTRYTWQLFLSVYQEFIDIDIKLREGNVSAGIVIP